MAITRTVLCTLFVLYVINGEPEIRIQVFEPHGIRVTLSVLEQNYIKFVVFTGLVSRDTGAFTPFGIGLGDFGTPVRYGVWVYENAKWESYIGDEITFDVFTSNIKGYTNSTPLPQLHGNYSSYYLVPGVKYRKRIVVKELEKNFEGGLDCQPSVTKLRKGVACSGKTIFEENFDDLDTDVWQIEHYIPKDHPEHPFVSYQRLVTDPTVYVRAGKLYIQPRLQHRLPGFNDTESLVCATLDLSAGCTRKTCVERAVGDVVPPVASGRVTSSHFAFTYGIVTIRAKLPQGDWLYPEILLEPYANKYGSMSGIIKIAMALGSKYANPDTHSHKVLHGWPILSEKCQLFKARSPDKIFWGDYFHEYTVKWTPDGIEFGVDGQMYGNYTPDHNGFRAWLPRACHGDLYTALGSTSRVAPFDDHFYITLGVAAGGIGVFPDNMNSLGKTKPWRDGSRKAALNFLQDVDKWFPTWTYSALVVDYVKVVAL